MARKIEHEYHIKDKGSSEIKKASNKISSELKSIEKVSNNVTSGISSSWKKLAGVVAGAFAFSQIVSGLKSITQAASDLQEVTSKFETVFAGNMETATAAVDELTASYAMSTREARQYLASIQDLLVPMGVAATEAANLSSEVVKLAADLGSFGNFQTADVIRDIQSALVGNFETMQKYGVVLNANVVAQEAMRLGLATSKNDLTAAAKAQAAYSLIVKSSAAAIGDMQRTSGGYANTLKRFKATVEDLAGSIGTALLPYFTDILQGMTDWIKLNQEFISQKFKDVVDAIAISVKFLADNVDLLIAAFIGFAGLKIGVMLTSIIGGLTTATAVTSGMTAASATLTSQIAALTTVLQSYNASWGRFTAQATAASAAATSVGTATRTAAVGVSALGASLATLGVYAAAMGLIYLGFKLWKGRTDELNVSLKKTDEIMKGIESTTNKILLQDQIKLAYKELDRLFEARAKAQKELDDIVKNPDGSISTMKIGGTTQYENLNKIEKKINDLMGLIGDTQSRLDTLRSGKSTDPGGEDNAGTVLTDKLKKELEDRVKMQEKMMKDQQVRYLELTKQAQEAEKQAVRNKYADLIEQAAGYGELVKTLRENLNRELAVIDKKYDDERYEKAMEALDKRIAEGMDREKRARDQSSKAIMELNEKNKEAMKKLEESGKAFLTFMSTRFADGLLQIFDDVNSGALSAADAFKKMAASILKDLARMLIQMAFFNAMKQAFGGYGGAAGAIGSFFGMATGGHVNKNEAVVVGEKGPELFLPDGGGTIMSNTKSNRMTGGGEGGGTNIFNININRPVGSDEDAKRTGKLIQNEMRAFFDRRLAYQSKPGGILRPQPAMR